MNDVLGLIFAYSSDRAMRELVDHRTAASVPIAARYRCIDFMLSSMINSDINDVGVIMRQNYQSLLDHVGSGKDWDLSRKRGGLMLLPPFGYRMGSRDYMPAQFYRGKMDAILGVRNYISTRHRRYVVLADGELIANVPIDEALDAHIASGADVTVVCTHRNMSKSQHNAFYIADKDGRVKEILINPEEAGDCRSIGVFILEKSLLERLMDYCAAHGVYLLEKDVLQKMIKTLDVRIFSFEGYCAESQSIIQYYRVNMDILNRDVRNDLFLKTRPIYTKVRDEPSTYYGETASVNNSIIADGCYIEGKVENSVIFRGVRIGKGAKVKNSIIMQSAVLQEGSSLNNCIVDKGAVFREGRMMMGSESYPVVIAKESTV